MQEDPRDPYGAPRTQASGEMEPPGRKPPGAVGADAAGGEPPPPRPRRALPPGSTDILDPREWRSAVEGAARTVLAAADRVAEGLDPLGDRIAELLRIRRPPTPPL